MDPSKTDLYKYTFFPLAAEAGVRVQRQGNRFVYYTTAATALQIIRNQQIWMRNTQVMNDVMEVEHGVNCLTRAYNNSPAGKQLDEALDTYFPGLSAEVKSLFGDWIPKIKEDTFVTSMSEHLTDDDLHGRLSMWRAYGGTAGVALVLNGGPMFRPSDALAAYTSPVGYFDEHGVANQIWTVACRLRENPQFVQGLGRETVKNAFFYMLRYTAVCTKHPAFKEEREWRVVASPALQSSPLLTKQVEVIGAVPQLVLKIDLKDHKEHGLFGFTPNDFLERALIGPCEHPKIIHRALVTALAEVDVQSPESRVFITGIPLRANQR